MTVPRNEGDPSLPSGNRFSEFTFGQILQERREVAVEVNRRWAELNDRLTIPAERTPGGQNRVVIPVAEAPIHTRELIGLAGWDSSTPGLEVVYKTNPARILWQTNDATNYRWLTGDAIGGVSLCINLEQKAVNFVEVPRVFGIRATNGLYEGRDVVYYPGMTIYRDSPLFDVWAMGEKLTQQIEGASEELQFALLEEIASAFNTSTEE